MLGFRPSFFFLTLSVSRCTCHKLWLTDTREFVGIDEAVFCRTVYELLAYAGFLIVTVCRAFLWLVSEEPFSG